jgi:hypothetical protein
MALGIIALTQLHRCATTENPGRKGAEIYEPELSIATAYLVTFLTLIVIAGWVLVAGI